jgi:membrane-bound lytic murein transglycosylase C
MTHMSTTRTTLLALSLILVSSCSMNDYHHSVELTSLHNPEQALNRLSYQTSNYHALTQQDAEKDTLALQTLQDNYSDQVTELWGSELAQFSSRTRYVKYSNNYRSRSIIDFQQGSVQVDTLAQQHSKQFLKQVIEYTLLAPDAPEYTNFYTAYSSEVKGTPFLYQQVRDQDGKLIKWHWRAAHYANYLIKHNFSQTQSANKQMSSVTFALVPNHTLVRMQRYQPLIRQYAKRHGIDENVVRAIIQTESLFNPYALNATGRVGLMQISANSIGQDVFRQQKKYPFYPTQRFMFAPHNNLDLGVGYLNLLDQHYLSAIKDPNSRHFAMLASYIAGPKNMLQTFSKDKTEAFAMINSLSSYEVYQSLTSKLTRPEIKDYVYQVNSNYRKFSE